MVVNEARAHVPHMIFVNGGSQRFDVFRGPFTYDTSFLVSPFTSRFWFARDVPWHVADSLLEYFNNDPSPYSAQALARGDLLPARAELLRPDHQRLSGSQAPLGHKGPRAYRRVKGYTTADDFGREGDDTVHKHFAKYQAPKVVQSNASFPEDGSLPRKVDVVFFDFIAQSVADGLNSVVGVDVWGVDGFERYMGEDQTLTKLILEFVEKKWGKECA